jgi:hypothetical protein
VRTIGHRVRRRPDKRSARGVKLSQVGWAKISDATLETGISGLCGVRVVAFGHSGSRWVPPTDPHFYMPEGM